MKHHRFIIDFDSSQRQVAITDKEIINQITHVLRLGKGDSITLCDGKLTEATATIISFDKKSITLAIEHIHVGERESKILATLYCAILKRENFELVAQKATEIGVSAIVPIISQRTVKLDLRHERLQKIIKEAAEQSGRTVVPMLHPAISLKDALEKLPSNHSAFFFDASGEPVKQTAQITKEISIFIGPEGGWDGSELALAKTHHCIIKSLGNLTLRAETAAIIASYLSVNL
ncbi:16S rRNA (uracil(1498)-N(3))-methyltransferase [Patescibacteria group bacterium]|nr:MAG: 16S rRNA (uracil(1498)-N(3))-methyltransferase [Patescibacteria group bacterium]